MADVLEVLYWPVVQEGGLSDGGVAEEGYNLHGDEVLQGRLCHWQVGERMAQGFLHLDLQCNQAVVVAVAEVVEAVAAAVAVVVAAAVVAVAVVTAVVAAAVVADAVVAGVPAGA